MKVGDRVESVMGGRRGTIVGPPHQETAWAGYGQKPLQWTLVLVAWDDVEDARSHERWESLRMVEEGAPVSRIAIRAAYNVGWHAGKYRSGWHAHRRVKESIWTQEEKDAYWRGFQHGRQGLKADSRRGVES